jgi:hypothetical protein
MLPRAAGARTLARTACIAPPLPRFGTTPTIRSGSGSASPWEKSPSVIAVRSERGRLAAGNSAKLSPFLLQMRMNVRVEECRRRAAECAEKALCQPDPEIRQIFAELAEQWPALAEQTEFLERFH